jgi:hypothetical protein
MGDPVHAAPQFSSRGGCCADQSPALPWVRRRARRGAGAETAPFKVEILLKASVLSRAARSRHSPSTCTDVQEQLPGLEARCGEMTAPRRTRLEQGDRR